MRLLYFTRRYTPHDHRFLTAMRDLGAAALLLRLEPDGGGEARPLPEGVHEAPYFFSNCRCLRF